jgi:hypothetical protein
MKNNLTPGSARLEQEPAAETSRTLDEDSGKHVKIYTDRSKMGDKVGYAVVKELCLKTQCSVRSSLQFLKQSAIGENNRHEKVLITDSLSTIMAVEKCWIMKDRALLFYGVAIPGYEKVDQAAKELLDEDISTIERYPPDLKIWLTEEDFKKRH